MTSCAAAKAVPNSPSTAPLVLKRSAYSASAMRMVEYA